MRIKEVLTNYELCLVDLAVMLNGKTIRANAMRGHGGEVIPLNTPDSRPIQMNKANAIKLDL